MTALMIGNDVQISFTQDQRTLGTDENLVQSLIKAVLGHGNQIATCCQQSRFVDEIGDVGANHPRGGTGDGNQVHIFCQRNIVRVNLENGQAPIPVGTLDCHTPVEAAGAQERFVQPVRSIRGSNHHHGLARLKAVHLHQQLVQGLVALVAAIDADPTLTTYSINFIEEDDAGRGFLVLIEEITHAAGANTDQHLDKLRTAHREEGHSRLACHGTRQQGLSGSRRAYQQHPTGHLATQPLELVWGLQKFNHLNQIVFRFVDARDISKGRTRSISWHDLGAGLPKAEDVLLALCCSAAHKEEDAQQENQREKADYNVQEEIMISHGLRLVLYVIPVQ